ncbi:MAG: DUF5989 family protein [Candidatus Aenigmatarchaeota archaeon]
MERFYLLKDVLKFLWKTKRWWLIPLICLLFLLGLMIYSASISPIPIFAYPLI